jgi:hypothetical protein
MKNKHYISDEMVFLNELHVEHQAAQESLRQTWWQSNKLATVDEFTNLKHHAYAYFTYNDTDEASLK